MGSVTKAFSDIITFTRASAATRINAAGVIETVAANVPRIDYDPVTLQRKGLLIEEQRTNLIANSQSPSVILYQATGSVGSYTLTNGYTSYVRGSYAITASVGETFTISFDIFGTPGAQLGAGLSQLPSYSSVIGLLTLSATRQRRSVTVTTNSANTSSVLLFFSTPQNGVSFTIENVQIERGLFPSSYIPTAGSQVTRAVSDCKINTQSQWFAHRGVLLLDYLPIGGDGVVAEFSNTENNRWGITRASNGDITAATISGGLSDGLVVVAGASPAGQIRRAAVSLADNDLRISVNGGAVVKDSAVLLPVNLSVLQLGARHGLTMPFNGWLRRVSYFNKAAASDAALMSLSAI